MKEKMRLTRKAIFLSGLVLATAYVLPFFLVFLNAFKPKIDILVNPLAWPKTFTMDNFTQALEKMDFFRSLTNSVFITVFSVGGLIIFSSMLAYYLARNKNKFTKTTFLILVASMIVPFQALMIPFMALFAPMVSCSRISRRVSGRPSGAVVGADGASGVAAAAAAAARSCFARSTM